MQQVTLHLGETTLALTIGATQHLLPTGIATLAQAFDHHMPNALALENAIADVEDAIMPAVAWLPAGTHTLSTSDPVLRQLVHTATGQPTATQASCEAVESLFNALARQAQQPGFHDLQLTQTAEAAAALLVLREAMHHWGMNEIALL